MQQTVTKLSSITVTPIEESMKKMKVTFTEIYWTKQKKPKFLLGGCVRTADKKISFCKSGTTRWSYNFYETTELIDDTKPTCHKFILPVHYN